MNNNGYTCTCTVDLYPLIIQGSPGVNGVPGRSVTDEEVAEICRLVLRENLEELTANLQGPVGLPGPLGPKGQIGQPGPQGMF